MTEQPDFRRMPIADAVRWLAENGEPADPRTDVDTAALKRRFPHLENVETADIRIDGPHGRLVPARLYRDADGNGIRSRPRVGARRRVHRRVPRHARVELGGARTRRARHTRARRSTMSSASVTCTSPSRPTRCARRGSTPGAHAGELFGIDADAVLLGGASAGGNLTAGAVAQLQDAGDPVPAGLILVYPVVHPNGPGASPEVDLASAHGQLALNFAGSDEALRDPHAFAALGRVDGFPPHAHRRLREG